MTNINDLVGSLDDEQKKKNQQQEKKTQLDTVKQGADQVSASVDKNTETTAKALKDVQGKVEVTNPDLAKSGDLSKVVDSINKMNVTTFMGTTGFHDMAENISRLSEEVQTLQKKLESEGLTNISENFQSLVDKLSLTAKTLSSTKVSVDSSVQKTIDNLSKSIAKMDFKPSVNVNAPETKVISTPVDLKPVIDALSKVELAVKNSETPEQEVDLKPVISGLKSVQDAIQALRFPVPNYVLPFVGSTGKAVQVKLNDDGTLPVTTSVSTGSLATSANQTNGTQKTQIVDGSGNVIASTGNALNVAGSFSSTPPADVAPATQNITVVDSSSVTTSMANNQSFIIGTPTAGSAASFALSSIETVRVEVTGIWTGTITTETSVDGGTTWVSQGVHQGAYTTSSFTLGFVGGCNVSGATNFRVRATAAITGTAVVKVIESVNTQSVYIANAAPSGTVISALNSSSATLTSGSVYTGTGEDVTNFSEMRVSVFSDVASATDGLSLQQSSNGTNWDITDTYTVSLSAAGAGKTYVVPRQARFFRVVYTNGGTNQTSFRLQTILNRTATAPSSQRASDGYTNETDLVQNQAFLMGYNGTTWDRIRTVGTGVVSASAVLTAGSAIIGKVGIDQTTPGTTNAVSANQGTAAALASPWPTYNGEISDFTGTFTNATQTNSVTASGLDGYGNILISITGTYGTATAVFEGSDDSGTTWFAVDAAQTSGNTIEGGYTSLTNVTRSWQINVPGFDSVRVRSTAVASGTVNVRMSASAANGADGATVGLAGALPTGANTIGAVTGTGTFAVQTTADVPGTGATNLGKAEDAAHASGDTGVFALAVRNDNLGTTYASNDQDYAPIAVDLNSRVMVAQKAATATLSNVSTSTTSATLLAANASRIGAQITNDAATAIFIKFGTTASATSYTVSLAGAASAPFSYYEVPAGYTGRIDGILASSTGTARVTEET